MWGGGGGADGGGESVGFRFNFGGGGQGNLHGNATPMALRTHRDTWALNHQPSTMNPLNPVSALRNAEELWPKANWQSFDFGRSNHIETTPIPVAKTGRLFAHFTGSRPFHQQSASLVGREGEISGESRGSSGDWVY